MELAGSPEALSFPAMNNLTDYYDRRAPEYDNIYKRPERQDDLKRLEAHLLDVAGGQDVMEIACGTGWWTERMARTARTVMGFDASPAVLARARQRGCPPNRVRFAEGDAFRLGEIGGRYSLVVAAFLWSHIPRRDIQIFLNGIARRFPDGIRVVMVDNRYVEGGSSAVSRRDDFGNSWQKRKLEDGSEFEIIKNFPSADELTIVAGAHLDNVDIKLLDYFWILQGDTRPIPPEPKPEEKHAG
ncbi:MAG: ubiquinone/menaquinone biosynthesis methyltransferase [bacterium]|nr:MAG: ubiquinone/menaquinone biosynthesis methyltransferase [bacterium]